MDKERLLKLGNALDSAGIKLDMLDHPQKTSNVWELRKMIRSILFVAVLLFTSSVTEAQYPFNYSRSTKTYQGTIYYGKSGQIVGRSFNTPTRTYYTNRYGRSLGSSFTTPSGNTYFNRTYQYNSSYFRDRK